MFKHSAISISENNTVVGTDAGMQGNFIVNYHFRYPKLGLPMLGTGRASCRRQTSVSGLRRLFSVRSLISPGCCVWRRFGSSAATQGIGPKRRAAAEILKAAVIELV